MKKSISELLKYCAEGKTANEKIERLQQTSTKTPALLAILKYAFDPSIVFLLPDTDPPYKPTGYVDQESRLYSELRRLYLFIEGGNPKLTKVKREMLFIQLLESVDPSDAVLLCSMKNKRLPYKELTSKLVLKAFPNLYTETQNEQNLQKEQQKNIK